MGLIETSGLLVEVAGVFEFLRGCYDALPNAIKILIFASFGGMVYIGVLKSFR